MDYSLSKKGYGGGKRDRVEDLWSAMDAIAVQLPQHLPHLFSLYFFLKRSINILSSQQMDIFPNKCLQITHSY